MKVQIICNILLSLVLLACENKNHIDKYKVDIEEINKLPDNFYAYRRDKIYYSNDSYMIWFNRNYMGNIESVFEVKDLNRNKLDLAAILKLYKIDTTDAKKLATEFIKLSRKYKFGHINIDKKNKIAISSIDGLPEQYVFVFNDSVRSKYFKNNDFRLLNNGWFEYNGN